MSAALLSNNKLNSDYLVLLINLNPFYSTMHTYALMNNNRSAIAFINKCIAALY